ncbi:tape measure protein [Xenorhabdus griffiniae]|uniref:Tape measure protein n=1 Tax=Xenorhabdus griffiniae TaxID=351672 RepID=A0ABY9XM78_9GAMM|nr:tape measure protein [Xenorhabdus griffiniae]MBD1228309.1 tape measure protein [Xenorhabdus griffiniae]MBE8587746.1 tape measure protein [Xenorhabdus griffiniae]WMV74054.1 tape measure protein [Xenorhabdus griffiniae]WNH03734.1 tape measure protein [Xenorhabdus griffiniae]
MAEVRVGNIVYQVSMDVAQLLEANHRLDSRMGQLEQRFNQTGRAVNGAEKALLSLSRAATAVTAALSVEKIAGYADAWVTVNNKLVNATKANESLAEVSERVFTIAQNSRASLDSTAALYGRLERATRAYGTSADDVAKLTETVAKGLVVSGATAAESSSVMIQFSQAMASGVLRGEEFNSMSENGSRLIAALSDHLGVNIGQLRKMAAEGKLTSTVVAQAFLAQAGTIAKEFDKTSATMSQSIEMAANNMTRFFGQSTTVQTALKAFNSTLVTVSENMDLVAGAATALAAVMGSRMVGAMTLAASQKITNVRASIALAQANKVEAESALHAATMTLRKAEMDKIAAIEAVRHAEAEYAVVKGTDAEAAALARLNAARVTATTATGAYKTAQEAATAAQIRHTTAVNAASVAMNGLKGAMALLGGPLGIVMLAATALYYFHDQAENAKNEAKDLSNTVETLTGNLKEMNKAQLEANKVKLERKLAEQQEQVKKQETKVSGLQWEVDHNGGFIYSKRSEEEMKKLRDDLAIAKGEREDMKTVENNYKEAIALTSKALAENTKLTNENADANKNRSGDVDQASDKAADFITKLKQENELLRTKKGLERDLKAAELKGKAAGASPEQQKQIADLVKSNKELEDAEKKREDAKKEAENAAKKAADEAKRRSDDITAALKRQRDEIDRLKTGYEESSLAMAQYDAAKAMPEGSSPEQIKKARRNAAERYDLEKDAEARKWALEQDSLAKSKKAMDEELEHLRRVKVQGLIEIEEFNKREQEIRERYKNRAVEEEKQRKINEAVSPTMNALGEFDPVQNLINEHKRKIAAITDFEQRHTELKEQAESARATIEKKYQEDLATAQWEQWKGQSEMYQFMGSAVEALGQRSANAITGLLTGTQTANEAMRNLALTITNEAVSALVQMGMQQIKNMIMGKALAAASTATTMAQAAAAQAAWAPAALSASIATLGTAAATGTTAYMSSLAASKAFAIAGARKNGGPVSPNGAYRIGENNKPEIFKANNGNQYLVPGDRGKVISNREMGGGNGRSVIYQPTFQISISTQGGVTEQDARMLSNIIDAKMNDFVVNQMRDNGLFEKIGY